MARTMVVHYMRTFNYTYEAIAKKMKRHYSTIIYLHQEYYNNRQNDHFRKKDEEIQSLI